MEKKNVIEPFYANGIYNPVILVPLIIGSTIVFFIIIVLVFRNF